jgi:hypothetical protein
MISIQAQDLLLNSLQIRHHGESRIFLGSDSGMTPMPQLEGQGACLC